MFGYICKIWIDETLKNDCPERESKWSESIAAGRKSLVEEVHKKRGYKSSIAVEGILIREPAASYNTLFENKNAPLRAENTYLLNLN